MKRFLTYFACFCYIITFFGACESGSLRQYTYHGPAHLIVTNIDTGEVREESSSLGIYIGGAPEDLTIKHGETLEIKFIPPQGFKDHKFDVNILFLDKDFTIHDEPYSIRVTIGNNVPVGSYPIYCSAMSLDWSDESSCKQSMGIKITD